ncbi:MAG: hypothetical protein JWM98_2066 [Thermoleophilia bacterium]|nr:hypothetical protein [Thermoleophilia bacterium]
MKLRTTLMAALATCCFAPAAAQAATPPTAPTNVTATVVPDGQYAATVDVAWTASTDADGQAISYDVEIAQFDFVRIEHAATNSLRVSVSRGEVARVRVVAVDAGGSRSEGSTPILFTAPPVPVRLALGVSPRGGFAQSCAGVLGACRIGNLATASLRVRATSTAVLTGAHVRVSVLWRKPGTTRFVVRPAVTAPIFTGRASIPLSKVVRGAGTWCMRVGLDPATGAGLTGRAAFTPTCVRYG